MSYAVDSNILLRIAQDNHPMHAAATSAVATLFRQGEVIHVLPQNLYEFWVVATRPADKNGLGLSAADAGAELVRMKRLFQFAADTPNVYAEWERLVTRHGVMGKPAHDARIVAATAVHGITHLLTFNAADFKRFPAITVLTPDEVLKGQPPP
jgi:predicted nucleic acid-binding protein